jgi:CubicO group peptidase (beta-lactamase class C family)
MDVPAFDRRLVAAMSEAAVPGLSIALVQGDGMAQVAAYGVRRAMAEGRITDRTVFEAASLSKPVFSYAVLQLADAGMLSLDDPLSNFLPNYIAADDRASGITARHVLSHTTGLPNWRTDTHPLRTYFPPGQRFSYSGEGFVNLQRVVERILGEPLDAIMRRLVFIPLGMESSSYIWQERFERDFAEPHHNALTPGTKHKPRDANAAYSLHTTATDYASFLRAVLAGTRLDPSTVRLWLEPVVSVPRGRHDWLDTQDAPKVDTRVAWGLGWGLEPEAGTFFHWGSNEGFSAFAIGSVRDGKALVLFANGDNGLALAPGIVGAAMSGDRPSLAWLGHGREES